MADVYKDVSYNLDQDAYTAAEYNDVVRKRFIRQWTTLLDGFKVGLVLIIIYLGWAQKL